MHELKGHGFGTAALAWQPSGNLLASVGQDGKVRLWDATTGQEAKALDAGASWAEKLAWHPPGSGSHRRGEEGDACSRRPANWSANCRRRPAR